MALATFSVLSSMRIAAEGTSVMSVLGIFTLEEISIGLQNFNLHELCSIHVCMQVRTSATVSNAGAFLLSRRWLTISMTTWQMLRGPTMESIMVRT